MVQLNYALLSLFTIAFNQFLPTQASQLLRRDFNYDEHVVLADCGIGSNPSRPGDSSSRQMLYYSRKPRDSSGAWLYWVKPDMNVDVPWDGSYPWRRSGVKVPFPNGDVFNAIISPLIADSTTQLAGSVSHKYDKNNFACYGAHNNGVTVHTLPDGTKCNPAYVCDHYRISDPNKPEPPKTKKYTTWTLSSTTVNLTAETMGAGFTPRDPVLASPKDVFKNVYKAIEGTQCKPDYYPIAGSSCSIRFTDCFFTGGKDQQKGTAEELAKVLVDAASVGVQDTLKEWKKFLPGRVPRSYKYKQYTYPRTGTVLANVEVAGKTSSGGKLSYEISCKADSVCNKGLCLIIASGATGAGRTFPPLAWIGLLLPPVCNECS